MSRRRGRRRHRWSRAVTFPRCPPSDTHADQKGGRLRFLKAAAITVLILVAVTSIAAVVMTAESLSNTGEDKPTINLPPYGSKGDDQAGSGDSEGLVNGPDGMASTAAPLTPDGMVPVGMTPPAGHAENVQVLDNQTETFRSEGWKRFCVEQNHTNGANSTTEVPTVPPHVVGDEEGEAAHDWGYTTGGNHCSNVRVRHRVSKVPRHDSETYQATDDSSAADTTHDHPEPKPNCSLDKKSSGDVDSMDTAAMINVHAKNSTDMNLYLDAVLTDIMKSRKRKHYRGLKRIKRSKAIIVLAAVGVLIAGSVAHVFLRQIVP
ncbi:Tubulointerstitial nephritis antigen-like [Branchiostoma belcheri]|nr:Tubulointerstitial nephritis antigen-like [Branchiostoma belcheri]